VVFGTNEMVAAGIDYATDLAIDGYNPMVINMGLGGPDPSRSSRPPSTGLSTTA
jgi:hypothetical protein